MAQMGCFCKTHPLSACLVSTTDCTCKACPCSLLAVGAVTSHSNYLLSHATADFPQRQQAGLHASCLMPHEPALTQPEPYLVQEVPLLDEENFPSLGSTHGPKSPGDSQSPRSKSETSPKAEDSPKAPRDGFAAAAAKPPAAEVCTAACGKMRLQTTHS